jgi:hypothetical protein
VTCFAGVDAGGDTFRLRMWQVLRSHIAWERADMEVMGMFYSSRSGRAPRRGGSLALRLACDAHSIRGTTVRRAAGRRVVACPSG